MKNEKSEEIFDSIYRRHYTKVRYFAYKYLEDTDAATDVAQDVFLSFWENIKSVDLENDLVPYLLTLTKNKCMNIIKRKGVYNKYSNNYKRLEINEINADALKSVTISKLYSKEISGIYSEALEQMPQKTREVYLMCKEESLKYKEIAIKNKISVKLVEYRMMSALRILRKNFKDYLPFLFMVFRDLV